MKARTLPLVTAVVLSGCISPIERPDVTNLPVVSAGYATTCVLTPSRSVQCFGSVPGDGTFYKPHTVAVQPEGVGRALKVVAGRSSFEGAACVINDDPEKSVSCWTQYLNGAKPIKIPGVAGATDIGVASTEACAIVTGGSVTCWPLGGSMPTPAAPRQDVANATAISGGFDHFCVNTADKSVVCWGRNLWGQLGRSTSGAPDALFPASAIVGLKADAVSAGHYFTCALLTDKRIACWGINGHGELGNGVKSTLPTPSQQIVSGIAAARSVSAGWYYTCATLQDMTVSCWGDNDKGMLGNGTTTESLAPVKVLNLSGIAIVSAGNEHACASGLGRKVRCWGNNTVGQLADGTTNDALSPAP